MAKFEKGQSGNPEGRPKGSKNRYTRIKEMVCDVLERRKGELDTIDLKDVLKFVASTSPKEIDLRAEVRDSHLTEVIKRSNDIEPDGVGGSDTEESEDSGSV